MGKNTKNFSLLMRKGNSRVPLRRLRDESTTADETTTASSGSSSAAAIAARPSPPDEWSSGNELKLFRRVDPDWTMSRAAALKILVSIRLSASLWSIISDCDEVYNYWEPLHLVLFGRGFQTWEYAPVYAIRSWLYVLLYALPAKPLLYLIGSSKVALFFTIRFLIGSVSMFAELSLYESVCRRAGNSVGRAFLLFTLLSPAMFGASCAFLPSAFSMALNALAMAFWLQERWFLAIFLTAFSALVGWPFAALLGLPIVVQMVLLRPHLASKFLLFSSISGTLLLTALCAVDTFFFGKFVMAPLNIVLYNLFSAHGPTLYGVEPVSFYVRNLLLNFNVAVPLALFGMVGLLGVHFMPKNAEKNTAVAHYMQRLCRGWPLMRDCCGARANAAGGTMPFVLIGATTMLWSGIFFMQPHKEERFLFPIYPHICVLAALGFDLLRRLFTVLSASSLLSPISAPIRHASITLCALLAILFTLFSLSRIVAIHRNYAGLMDTYSALNKRITYQQQLGDSDGQQQSLNVDQMQDPIRLCVGKEWHRFPSSFFLPESAIIIDHNNSSQTNVRRRPSVEMEFVRSDFHGILPTHFATDPDGLLRHSTAHAPLGRMNDENREELDRYVPAESCDFFVHLEDEQETELEPNFAKMAMFQSIEQRPVLLPAKSHPFFRAFYIPFINSDLTFGTLHLLQKVNPL